MKYEPKPGWKSWRRPQQDNRRDRWGLRGKTAWDWLDLMIVPVMLALFAGVFTTMQIVYASWAEDERQQDLTAQTAKIQQVLEHFRVQEASLQEYLDLMTNLLLNHNLRGAEEGSEVRAIAQTQTLTTLRKMDPQGKRTVVLFLGDARLIQTSGEGLSQTSGEDEPILDLTEADLTKADLTEADLSLVYVDGANLRGANLSGANFRGANLPYANLRGADLSNADLGGANLPIADLRIANLSNTDLKGTNLTGASLSGADLSDAYLSDAYLSRADLSEATGLTVEQVTAAKSLDGAIMPNGQKYEDWLKSKGSGEDGENSGPS